MGVCRIAERERRSRGRKDATVWPGQDTLSLKEVSCCCVRDVVVDEFMGIC